MKSLKLVIPMDYNVLTRTASMLQDLAKDVQNSTKMVVGAKPVIIKNHSEAVEEFGNQSEISKMADTADKIKDNVVQLHTSSEETTPPPPVEEENREWYEGMKINGVEVDAQFLPWDSRIHGKSKLKTKKDNFWKKIKNIGAKLDVSAIEAELRKAMDIPINSTITAEEETPPPVEEETPPPPVEEETPPPPPAEKLETKPVLYNYNGKQYTREALKKSNWPDAKIDELEIVETSEQQLSPGMTFPQFMAKFTAGLNAKKWTEEEVKEILIRVSKGKVTSMMLLSVRPDLLPAVDKALFG